MFVSFFPQPRRFFLSAIGWTALVMVWWYADQIAEVAQINQLLGYQLAIGANNVPAWLGWPDPTLVIGVQRFWSVPFLWFYAYWAIATAIFTGFWMWYAPHPWVWWSILGTSLIMFFTYFSVQVSVAIVAWQGPFFNVVQDALAKTRTVPIEEYFGHLLVFSGIAFLSISIAVFRNFFISHYIFRWRTAMNHFFAENWPRLRRVEGASQRVQEDTMRFAQTVEALGVSLISSVMTLIAFLPVLHGLETALVTELPLIGAIPFPLVFAALFWAVFGTGLLAVVGIRLPGLEFRNQMVEAAFRKELVYGEDDSERAQPQTLRELFTAVRKNYFRLYFNFAYFNIARFGYAQADAIFVYLILAPTLVAGKLTLGTWTQITNAFARVSASFDYLINAWSTIVELISIYKRIRAFESILYDKPMDKIERENPPDEMPHPELLGDTIKPEGVQPDTVKPKELA